MLQDRSLIGVLACDGESGGEFDVSFLFKKTLLSSLPNKMEALGSEGHM